MWRKEFDALVPGGVVMYGCADEELCQFVLDRDRPDAIPWLCEHAGVVPDWRVTSWAIQHSDEILFWFLWRRGTPWTNQPVRLSDPDCKFNFETDSVECLLVKMASTSLLDNSGVFDCDAPDDGVFHLLGSMGSLSFMLGDDLPAKYDCRNEDELRGALSVRVTLPKLLCQ